MAPVGAPGMAGGGVLKVGHIKAGDHLNHALHRLRLGRVHGNHAPVGDGAVKNFGHQHGSVQKIVGVFGAARDLIVGVHPVDTFADFHAGTSLFPDFWVIHPVKKPPCGIRGSCTYYTAGWRS
ncbi:hypothetical protein SDC9_150969 [bioreactor metagenome]|uniref:Uncharacterized protein n=1 Tax=bioreactor metagenome TaxID=1076179 RepID=A0A645EPJ6_9ZZZZ